MVAGPYAHTGKSTALATAGSNPLNCVRSAVCLPFCGYSSAWVASIVRMGNWAPLMILVWFCLRGAYAKLTRNDLVWDGLPKKPTSHTQYNTSAGRRLQSIGVSNAPYPSNCLHKQFQSRTQYNSFAKRSLRYTVFYNRRLLDLLPRAKE